MRVSMLIAAGAVTFLSLSTDAEELPPAGARACPAPITVTSKELKGARPDTTWYGFGPGVAGCRILNRKKEWLVEYTWFRLSTDLHTLRSYSDMDSLQAKGLLDSTTTVGTANYRSRVRAESPAEAKAAAVVAQPKAPPKPLLKAIADRN